MNELAIKYLKTYQVWHHRRLLIADLRTPIPELKFIEKCLRKDSKNYHTWSHRQWLLAHFVDDDDLWEGELDFIENAIGDDVRNNSAWNHRYFVVFGCRVMRGEKDRTRVARRELTYVFSNHYTYNFIHQIVSRNKISPSHRIIHPHGTIFVVSWITWSYLILSSPNLSSHTLFLSNPSPLT